MTVAISRMGRCAAALSGCLVLLGSVGCLTMPTGEFALPKIGADERYESETASAAGQRTLPEAGDWWKVFGDRDLDRLMHQMEAVGPSLQVALARYDQARTALGLARADQFPAITGDALWQRKRDSASGVFVPEGLTYSDYRAALNLDYEVDLWGRVRRSVAAAEADLGASTADFAAAELSLKAELARTWFQWRALGEEIRLLEETLYLREENRRLVQARVDGGEANDLDLARAETEVEATRAILLQLQRDAKGNEHALAALVGRTPAAFAPPVARGPFEPVSIPAGLPSELLARRPDIAAAEDRVHAAAERIGVVNASYLPRVSLRGTGGFSSIDLATWFNADSLFGEIGPSITFPIFQGGRYVSDSERAQATAREALASYEEIVLDAFREVETALADLGYLGQEIVAHRRAADSAERASTLSRSRYDGGLVSYLEVVDAERTALDQQRELTRSIANRRLAEVRLVQALGGGWQK